MSRTGAARTAAVVAVGDELIAENTDGNGPRLAARLEAAGWRVPERLVIPDDARLLARALGSLLARHGLVVVSGGLGPTRDDVTREAVALAWGTPLRFHDRAWRAIRRRFAARGLKPSPSNRRLARVPAGAHLLPNRLGTAPGLWCRRGARRLAALPGPPGECLPMLEREVLPRLGAAAAGRSGPRLVTLRVTGIAESALQESLDPLFPERGPVALGFLLDEPGEVLVRLRAEGADVRELSRAVRRVRARLGEACLPPGLSLPAAVGGRLLARGQTLAVAESCTGGLVARRLTSVPGASRYFLEGVVAYADAAKQRRLGVPAVILERHGAVSAETARAMVRGMRRRSRADWAAAVTGIAGPGGGRRDKPAGTVWLAWSGPGTAVETRLLRLCGDRDRIQRLAATAALSALYLALRPESTRRSHRR